MSGKKEWQAPLIRSIDQLGTVLGGTSGTGTTVTPTSPDQCNQGSGPSGGNCSRGNGAKINCNVGNGR